MYIRSDLSPDVQEKVLKILEMGNNDVYSSGMYYASVKINDDGSITLTNCVKPGMNVTYAPNCWLPQEVTFTFDKNDNISGRSVFSGNTSNWESTRVNNYNENNKLTSFDEISGNLRTHGEYNDAGVLVRKYQTENNQLKLYQEFDNNGNETIKQYDFTYENGQITGFKETVTMTFGDEVISENHIITGVVFDNNTNTVFFLKAMFPGAPSYYVADMPKDITNPKELIFNHSSRANGVYNDKYYNDGVEVCSKEDYEYCESLLSQISLLFPILSIEKENGKITNIDFCFYDWEWGFAPVVRTEKNAQSTYDDENNLTIKFDTNIAFSDTNTKNIVYYKFDATGIYKGKVIRKEPLTPEKAKNTGITSYDENDNILYDIWINSENNTISGFSQLRLILKAVIQLILSKVIL